MCRNTLNNLEHHTIIIVTGQTGAPNEILSTGPRVRRDATAYSPTRQQAIPISDINCPLALYFSPFAIISSLLLNANYMSYKWQPLAECKAKFVYVILKGGYSRVCVV